VGCIRVNATVQSREKHSALSAIGAALGSYNMKAVYWVIAHGSVVLQAGRSRIRDPMW
jgi:hypothetical protein